MSVNNLANGSVGSIQATDNPVQVESSACNGEAFSPEATDLPLIGDYVGMGGPNAVPLETQGAFEKPDHGAGNLLDDLFMSPTEKQLLNIHRAMSKTENAKNKSRLKWTILFHTLLGVVMAVKLLPEVLDKLDIFVLEIEELLIPKPQLWEWIWVSSLLPMVLAWSACKKSKVFQMQIFQLLNIATAVIPIVVGMSYHFSELSEVITGSEDGLISKWKGFSVAMLWYVFFLIALQVHGMEIFFAHTLTKAWQPKKTN